MSGTQDRDRTGAGQRRVWGIPGWAWAAGLALGFVIGWMMFDDLIIGLIFGASIGTAFAIGFATSKRPGGGPAGPGDDHRP